MIQENSLFSAQSNQKAQVDILGNANPKRRQRDGEFKDPLTDWLRLFSNALSKIERKISDEIDAEEGASTNEPSLDGQNSSWKKKTGRDSLDIINPQPSRPLKSDHVSGISLIDATPVTQVPQEMVAVVDDIPVEPAESEITALAE
ncbi:MAG: hypothetical protein WA151_15060, partial [Desulfatirhabdiaceae bacterium]